MALDLEISLLRTLVAIADAQNFRRAGTNLAITQSAVTLRVQKLEYIVGKPIVRRSRTGVELTEDGVALVAYARQILRLNDEALQRLSKTGAPEVVTVGFIEEFAHRFLPDFLNDMHRRYPRIRIDVIIDYSRNLRRLLDEDRIKLAVMKRTFAPESGEPLYRDPLVWVGATWLKLPRDRPVPLVISPEPCINRAVMIEALNAAGRRWMIASSSPTLSGVVAAVSAGLGVSAIDELTVQPSMRILGPEDDLPELPHSEITLLRRPDGGGQATERVANALRGFLASRADGTMSDALAAMTR